MRQSVHAWLDAVSYRAWTLASILVLVVSTAGGHHAPTEFDFGKIVEVEGTIVEMRWQNPHVTLKVREASARHDARTWEIEAQGVSMLRRTSAAGLRPTLHEKVRVAGHPSRRGGERLYGLNLLLANGEELVFEPNGSARWKRTGGRIASNWFDNEAEARETGIFRVWSTKLDDPWMQGIPGDRLTQAAKEKLSSFDRITDSVTTGCEPVGVPMVMGNPYPIEFVQEGDRIVLRLELYDLERVILMDPNTARETLPTGPLGRSLGRWDGASLVVTTDGLTWPFLDYFGEPMSAQASLVERFTPTTDGKRLHYSVTVTDPVYLTEPVTQVRSWIARPNESIKPYDCKE